MNGVEVTRVTGDERADYVFAVEMMDGHAYTVMLSEEYYMRLTSGKITPEKLVELSFDFLLRHEGPDSIMSEFELPTIQKYFVDYEDAIMSL